MGIAILICLICEEPGPVHWHHTVPRSRGGENSRQIPLCAGCHNSLHFSALAHVSKINNSKNRSKKKKKYWTNLECEQRAQPFFEILVEALIRPIPKGLEREHLVSASLSTNLFEKFKLLQLDLGLSSQDKCLEYCIKQMIDQRGLSPVNRSEHLWFMS